ncbi:MAG TPA: DUF4388 domain-containing protein [Candidatus Polarisedimenticolia bacterium]|nr:DUF4388 domain-containing protein [Candidatus Polarisedimenticolia bacterium]
MPQKPGLSGSLATMAFPDLLQWISQARKSGTLSLQHESLVKRLFLGDGVITSSGSNDPREFLGQIMISQQLLTEAQLKEAFDEQEKRHVMLGRVLVQKGWIPEEVAAQALKRKTEETVYSLFLWAEGSFEFHEAAAPAEEGVPIRLKVEEVLLEGLRRYDLAQKIRRAFPHRMVVLERTQVKPSAELMSNAFARKTLELVNGKRTLQDLCLELHAPEFTVSYFLLSALERGFVRVGSAGKETAAAVAAAPATDGLRAAKDLLRAGALEEALALLEQLARTSGQASEVGELMKVAEVNLIDRFYRGVLPPKQIPYLKRPLEQLTEESLTPEEVFLVSRVNGSWDLKSIVSISPLREVDALRVLKRLKERSIIALKEA